MRQMAINLFPAILLAGPPNCGKSVLSYLLTQQLRQLKISHYLLRAAPDGEGDWFYRGQAPVVRALRLEHKRAYSNNFVAHICAAIKDRLVPLLVDVGGRPQGNQMDILRACTHSILLYRDEAEKDQWMSALHDMNLQIIATLQSDLNSTDEIIQAFPVLCGRIGGLAREPAQRRVGMTFGALLDRTAGICRYDEDRLEQHHSRFAPFKIFSERQAGERLELPSSGDNLHWHASDLPRALALLTPGESMALYGRGPVWLAAALSAAVLPAEMSIFDVRYGWMSLPLETPGRSGAVEATVRRWRSEALGGEARLWELSLPLGVIEPADFRLPEGLETGEAVVLSGRLPRWAFAALARALSPRLRWVGVVDARASQVIVVAGEGVGRCAAL